MACARSVSGREPALKRDLAAGEERGFTIRVRASYPFAAKTARSRAHEYGTPEEAPVSAPTHLAK